MFSAALINASGFRGSDSERLMADSLLLEASDSFFAYEPVLKALQALGPTNFPQLGAALLLEAAPQAGRAVRPPGYATSATAFDLTPLLRGGGTPAQKQRLQRVSLTEPELFPREVLAAATTLDARQIDSIKHALTSEFSLIQVSCGAFLSAGACISLRVAGTATPAALRWFLRHFLRRLMPPSSRLSRCLPHCRAHLGLGRPSSACKSSTCSSTTPSRTRSRRSRARAGPGPARGSRTPLRWPACSPGSL